MARFALLADVLELQALGFERADQSVGPEGSRALAETCRQAVGARRIGDSRLWLAVGPLSPGFLVVQSHQIVGVPVAILLG